MTLKQLETLYAVMKAGSITAAARNLHVTQPAVSAVIKHVEMRLGMKLFERIGGRLHPTPEAIALQPDLQEIFHRVEAVAEVVRELRDGRVGKLVVAAPPTLVTALLPQALATLRASSPGLEIVVHSLPTALAIARVSRREADLGIVYEPISDAALDCENLLRSELVCVVPRGHPLARRRVVTAADIAGRSVISTGPRTPLGMLLEEAYVGQGLLPPKVSIEASSSLAACLMVSHGAGIALADRSIELCGKFPELRFRPLEPAIPIRIQVVFPRERARSQPSTRLLSVLQKQARLAWGHGRQPAD